MTTLLPPNATAFELALEAAMIRPDPDVPLRDLYSADDCPLTLLPWLAWDLGVSNWSDAWSEEQKRETIRQAVYLKSIGGTRAAITAVVENLGGAAVDIVEWWQKDPPGPRGTCSLVVDLDATDAAVPSSDFLDSVLREVRRVKRASIHLDFYQKLTITGGIGLKGTARPAVYRRLDFEVPPEA